MTVLISVFIFIFGAIIGSFLNVVIYRYNTGTSVGGRSSCVCCGVTLSWYELIPVISFLIQKGRCRSCNGRISLQYPTVEIATGFLFLLIFNLQVPFFTNISILNLTYYFVIVSLLTIIAVYDIRHKIIPNPFVYSFIFLSFFSPLFLDFGFLASDFNIWHILAGPILAAPFAFFWAVSKGRWMGLGDGKLALGIGWFLGLYDGFSAILLSFWIGAAVAVFLLLAHKKTVTIKSEIPFGPFLILGMILVWLFDMDVLSFFLL